MGLNDGHRSRIPHVHLRVDGREVRPGPVIRHVPAEQSWVVFPRHDELPQRRPLDWGAARLCDRCDHCDDVELDSQPDRLWRQMQVRL